MDRTSEKSYREIFPMRMTSIEKFHWFDDNPDFQNLIFCRMRFAEKIDQSLARHAHEIAARRQPFADVQPVKIKRRWHWENGPRGDDAPIEHWLGINFEWKQFASPPPDWQLDAGCLKSKTGGYLGVFVWPTPGSHSEFESEVWFCVHHALADGGGSILFANDWLLIYSNLINQRPPETGLHRLDPGLLKHRNRLGILSWRYLKHVPKQPIALFGATKFLFRKTAELIAKDSDSKDPPRAHYPSIIGQSISPAQTRRIAAHAKSAGVMVNSVLLGQLFLAIASWRKEQDSSSSGDWMRIILPMSIRNVSDRRLPTANRATLVQIDRCERETRELPRFYQQLDREIRIIRGWQLDKMFLLAIRGLSLFEPLLKRAARNPKSRGMAVFTNLGEPLRRVERAARLEAGPSLRPLECDFVGPIRAGTPANFTVSKFDSGLRLSLHYDSRVLSATQASRLLACYAQQLNEIEMEPSSNR